MGNKRRQSNVSRVVNSPLKISWFDPSSTAKIELYGYRLCKILKVLAGKHKGKVVDLLDGE